MPIRATAMGTLPGGVPWANVFHFVGDTITTTESAAIHAALRGFYAPIRPNLNNQWTHERTRFALRNSTSGQWPTVDEIPQVPPDAGASATEPMPNDCAVVCSWQTGQLTRRGRGRTYLGGFTSTALGTATAGHGTVDGAVVDDIVGAAEGLHAAAGGNPLAIWSEADLALHPVLRGYVGNLWDTQRRRERGLEEIRTLWSP